MALFIPNKGKSMSNKLDIRTEMTAFDRKDRNFYDNLTDDERKKFSNFMMLKWGSSVQGSFDLEAYYLRATNENLNVDFFTLSKHPKLQWLLSTTVSPGMGVQRHYYPKTSKQSISPCLKFLKLIKPTSKVEDLELLIQLNDQRHFEDMARQYGWPDEEIRKFFKT